MSFFGHLFNQSVYDCMSMLIIDGVFNRQVQYSVFFATSPNKNYLPSILY